MRVKTFATVTGPYAQDHCLAFGSRFSSFRRRCDDDLFDDLLRHLNFLDLGCALYDVRRYDEALVVFERMRRCAAASKLALSEAMALIWKGHMLDLLGRREEAVRCYGQAAEMGVTDQCMHGQYGLRYSPSPYARERMSRPFERVDNRMTD